MDWLIAALAVVAISALTFVPGALVCWAAGLRSLAAVALAPALTMALAGVGAILAGLLHVRWSLLVLASVTLVAVLVAWAIARKWPILAPRRLPTWSNAQWVGVSVAAVSAILAVGLPAAIGMRQSGAVLQKWDGLFHLNLVEYIRQTGLGSTLNAGAIANTVTDSFYPAAWHDVVALVPSLVPTTVAVNAGAFVTAVAVWIVALLYLARIVFPAQPIYAVIFAILGAIYQGSPVSLWSNVAHLPNALGTALLPALLAWTVQLARVIKIRATGRGTRLVILAIAVLGGTLAHPNTLFSYLALSAPVFGFIVAIVTKRLWRSHRRVLAVFGLAILAGVVVAGAYVIFARPEVQSVLAFEQPARTTTLGAVLAGLIDTTGAWTWGPNVTVAVLILVGLVVTIQAKRRRWLLASFAIVWFLYVAAAGDWLWLRVFTGLWYSDVSRLAALIPVAGIPICAIGAVWLGRHALFWWRRPAPLLQSALRPNWRVVAALSAALLVLAGVDGVVQVIGRGQAFSMAYPHRYDETRPLFLEPKEEELIYRLPRQLDRRALVLGDPFSGTAHLYGMIGQPVVFAHVNGVWDDDRKYLANHFNDLNTDPQVCRILRELNVKYFYSDPERYGDALEYPGLDYGVDTSTMRLIDRSGKTAIFEITTCG